MDSPLYEAMLTSPTYTSPEPTPPVPAFDPRVAARAEPCTMGSPRTPTLSQCSFVNLNGYDSSQEYHPYAPDPFPEEAPRMRTSPFPPTMKQEVTQWIAMLGGKGMTPAQIRMSTSGPMATFVPNYLHKANWYREGGRLIDKWIDETLYPGMSISDRKRLCDVKSRACKRYVDQKQAGKPPTCRKRTRAPNKTKSKQGPPVEGTRRWNVQRLEELQKEWPCIRLGKFKRKPASEIAQLLEEAEDEAKLGEILFTPFPDAPERKERPDDELCQEIMGDLLDRVCAPPQDGVSAYLDTTWIDIYERVNEVGDDIDLPEYYQALVRGKFVEAREMMVDILMDKLEEMPFQRAVYNAIGGYSKARAEAEAPDLIDEYNRTLTAYPPGNALAEANLDDWDTVLPQAEKWLCDRHQPHPAVLHRWLGVVQDLIVDLRDGEFDPDERDTAYCAAAEDPWALRGGGFGDHSEPADRARVQAVFDGALDDRRDVAPITMERILRSMVRVAADEADLDHIRGMSAQEVLLEAVGRDSQVAHRALEVFAQAHFLVGAPMEFVADAFFHGKMRTVRGAVTLQAGEVARNPLITAAREAAMQRAAEKVFLMSAADSPAEALDLIRSISLRNSSAVMSLDRMVMQGIQLQSRLWASLDPQELPLRNGKCVLDYIVQQVHGKRLDGLNHPYVAGIDDHTIVKQFSKVCDVDRGVSVQDIDAWLDDTQYPIGYQAIDPMTLEVFRKRDWKPRDLCLTFVVAHHHLYPITDKTVRKHIFSQGHVQKSDFGWFRTDTDDYVYLKESEETVQLIVDEKNEGLIKETIVYTDMDLEALLYAIASVHRQLPDQVDVQGSTFRAFVHPVSLKLVCAAQEWHERKAVCARLYEEYKTDDFHFRNQSWPTIAKHVAAVTVGQPVASTHADCITFDHYASVPLVQRIEPAEQGLAVDCRRCYTKALYHNLEPWLYFNVMDEIEVWDGQFVPEAEYYTCQTRLRGLLQGIELPAQITSYSLVRWLVENGYMDRKAVTHHRKAMHTHPHGSFIKFVEKAQALERAMPELAECKIGKKLVNMYIGTLNQRDDTKSMAFLCIDYEEALTHWARQTEMGRQVSIVGGTMPWYDFCVVKSTERTRRKQDHCPLWNQIIGNATLNVLRKAVHILQTTQARLVGIKTDCLFFTGVTEEEVMLGEEWRLDRFQVPEVSWCPQRSLPIELLRPWDDIEREEVTLDRSCMVEGPGGSGKTTLVMDLVNGMIGKVLCVAFTNTAVDNMRKMLDHADCCTISSALWRHRNRKLDIAGYDVLVIDEISMVTVSDMLGLMRAAPPVRIVIGDYNQVPPVEKSGVVYKFTEKRVFREWLDHRRCKLQFQPDMGRYDDKTRVCLEYLLDRQRLHPMLRRKTVDPRLTHNIVHTNARRQEIIRRLKSSPRFVVGEEVMASYDSMRCPESRALKRAHFFHSSFYTVREVTPTGYRLEDVDMEIKPAFLVSGAAVTTHKYQGKDCAHPFNIWQLHQMSLELAYTAISRTTSFDHIHLEWTDKWFARHRSKAKCTPFTIAELQHLWIVDGQAKLLKQGPHEEVEGTYRYPTYCQTEQSCRRTLALERDQAHQNVQRTIVPFHADNALHQLQIRRTPHKMTLHVGGTAWRMRYTKETEDEVIRALTRLGVAEAEKRYSSLGQWSYRPRNDASGSLELVVHPNVPVRSPYDPPKDPAAVGRLEKIQEAERLKDRKTLEQFFSSFQWYTRKTLPALQAIRHGTMIVRYGMFHMASMSRQQLGRLIQASKQTGTGCFFEDLHRNVRLCADLDWEVRWEERKMEPDHVALNVVHAANQVALRHGVVLEMDDWRFQNACTPKKISFHVVCPSEVFEIWSDQLGFWMETRNLLRDVHPDYFWHKEVKRSNGARVQDERCIIDTAIYKSAQPMRCVYSEKAGKGNFLLPKLFRDGRLLDCDATLSEIEQQLCSSAPPLVYSLLTQGKPRRVKGRSAPVALPVTSKPLHPDVRKRVEHLRLPEGFDLDHAETLANSIRLRRTKAGMCPCCQRTHERDNALLWSKGHQWLFRCFKPGVQSCVLGDICVN